MTRRRQRWLAAFILALLFIVQSVAVHHNYASRFVGGNDFYPRWAGVRALLREGRDPYDQSVTQEIATVLDPHERKTNSFSFAYPLHVLFVMWPLALLPYGWAYALWLVCLQWLVLLLAGIVCAWRRWRPSLKAAIGLMLATVAFYPVTRSILLGQFTIHVTFFLALCLLALQRNRDGWAGAALALTTIKPQMVVFIAPWFVAWAVRRRRWRFLAGLATGGAVLLVGSLAFELRWPLSFLAGISDYTSRASGRPPLPFLFEQGLGLKASWPAYVAGALLVVVMLFSWLRALRNGGSDGKKQMQEEYALCWSILVTLLVPFQTGSTGQVLLLVPFIAWLADLMQHGKRITALLSVLILTIGPWFFFEGQFGAENPLMLLLLPLIALVILVVKEIAGWQARGTETAGTAVEGAPSP